MKCQGCPVEFEPGKRRGSPRKFHSSACRIAYHHNLEKKGKAIIERRMKKPVPKESRFVNLGGLQVDTRLGTLADAARKLGIKEEGPILTAARQVGKAHRLQQMIRLGVGPVGLICPIEVLH